MFRTHISSQLPTDVSNKGSVYPNSIKKPVIINTQNQKSEPSVTKAVEHVDVPLTVQPKVEPSVPGHAQTRFSLGQQRRTSPHISEPMEKLVLASDKEDRPSNPIPKLNPPTKIEQVKDFEVINNTRDKPKSSFPDNNNSSQANVEPVKDYKGINGKWDKPLHTAPDQKNNFPIKVGSLTNYGVSVDKQDSPSSTIHNQTFGSPRKSHEAKGEKHDKFLALVPNNRYKAPAPKIDETKRYGFPDNKWGKATSQIQERPEKAEEYFTKVQNEVSRPTRYGVSGAQGNGGYIGNREAQMRYGNPNLSAVPFPHHTRTISSTEAVIKYGGTPV